MGDVNASIPTTELVYYRPMFGAMGEAKNSISEIFFQNGTEKGT